MTPGRGANDRVRSVATMAQRRHPHGDNLGGTPPATGPGRLLRFDLHRVATFSDGVLAIAITLLILSIRLPDGQAHSDADLQAQLRDLEAPLVAFLLSFAVIAVWWGSHQRLFAVLTAVDRPVLILNFVFLAAVAFLPFPTSVLGRYSSMTTAIVLYATTNTVIGGAVLLAWLYAQRAGLLDPELDADDRRQLIAFAAIAPAVFVLSIPVAFADPRIAPWSWNAVWIVVLAVRLQRRRRTRRTAA